MIKFLGTSSISPTLTARARLIRRMLSLIHIFPHIRNIDAVFVVRVALAGVNTNTTALIERQEKGRFSFQIGAHIDFVQVHGEVSQAARLEFQQSGLIISLKPVSYTHLDVYKRQPCSRSFDFQGSVPVCKNQFTEKRGSFPYIQNVGKTLEIRIFPRLWNRAIMGVITEKP